MANTVTPRQDSDNLHVGKTYLWKKLERAMLRTVMVILDNYSKLKVANTRLVAGIHRKLKKDFVNVEDQRPHKTEKAKKNYKRKMNKKKLWIELQ